MKKLLEFWKQDVINKFIVVITVLLLGVFGAFFMMLANMPAGKSLRGAASDILPFIPSPLPVDYVSPTPNATPTELPFNQQGGLTDAGSPAALDTPQPEQSAVPIMVTISYDDTATPGPQTLTAAPSPTATAAPATATPVPALPAATALPTAVPTRTGTPAPTAPVVYGNACLPRARTQTGKVLSVLDGNTARIMIDGLTYNVRLLGILAPTDKTWGEAARLQSARLIFGEQVTLIIDKTDKDDHGLLLRYIVAGDTFVNLRLVESGLAVAVDTPPDNACFVALQKAEQEARAAGNGMFLFTPTPVR